MEGLLGSFSFDLIENMKTKRTTVFKLWIKITRKRKLNLLKKKAIINSYSLCVVWFAWHNISDFISLAATSVAVTGSR